ncbi:histidine kinase [uncultured Dokdonia sp.]|uniref:histidine kinase n=1 Tax=uncultured Dokdonia sp. TaxID=575653 RepID=UPI002635CC13|nr:histidine kinase [uncultured Dokdonia sp.]
MFNKIFTLVLILSWVSIHAQERNSFPAEKGPPIMVRGSVIDIETLEPVPKVNVEITGGSYTTTGPDGEFRIRASVGDELVIRSTDFETQYYTIKDNQRIRVEVHSLSNPIILDEAEDSEKPKQIFTDYVQKARAVYKQDVSKGIDNIALALEIKTITESERAIAYELLADINSYWKQYDLAIANYKSSLKSEYKKGAEIKLAKAYFNNKNYQESIDLYQALLKKELSFEQNLEALEGLGDTYKATAAFAKAIEQYKKAERIATDSSIVSTATRLNTKIAESYDQIGNSQKAITSYNKALNLSNQENSESAARSKVKVADYYNATRQFDEEIKLRKEALQELRDVNTDSITNDDVLTPQKQNYKIASAYVDQRKFEEAIPFFEKSINEAANKNDLVVEKDATRRLSELYRDKEDFDKAAESYERYKSLVDQGYLIKEQELESRIRLGKINAEKQNRILSLEKDRELNEERYDLAFQKQKIIDERNNTQRLIIGSLIVVALSLLIAALAMYRSSKRQKYANNLLALKSLRSQMNPHFIFNALNSVNSFIATNDERTANKYLSDFSSLMRSVLENSEEDFIPLSSEIELIKKYTMLEHFRFRDKFDYTLTVDENLAIDEFQIPPMLLQPYVENAVWHGMRYKEEKGLLHINFSQKDADTAVITVTDDGVGRERSKAMKTDNQKKQKSKGMGNIKKRIAILNEMYGDRVDVVITDVFENGEGTKVTLTLKKD